MTISHHPSDETLLWHATGALAPGPALVIAVHLESCGRCRAHLSDFEAIGGQILDGMAPTPVAADMLARTLERLDAPAAAPREPPAPQPRADLGIALPRSLNGCGIGPWRWLGPGFRCSKVTIPQSPGAKVMFLKGRAGLRLPAHGHTGTEYMQIMSGWLSDQRGRYGAGDLDEAGTEVEHQPVVEGHSECLCLAALDGNTRLVGLLGRLLQPLVGF